MLPAVSVIIPCFNQGQFVDEAVDSVLAQTYQNLEIIVVNDGSTDDETNQLLQHYDRPQTRVISTDNQGLAAARNNGIREAVGEYILPLDADDRIGPTYLEQAVRLLASRKELGFVYCQAQLFGAVETSWQLPEFSLEQMLLDNIIFCSALFRRSDWQEIGGYDESLLHGWEDYDFWLSLLETGRQVQRISEVLFYYRVSADSMVRARPRQHKLDTFVRIYHKHKSLFSDHIDIWLDKLLDVNETYHEAGLTFLTESCRQSADQQVRKIAVGTSRLEFQLSADVQCHDVIFSVADDYVAVRYVEISFESQDTQEPLAGWSVNADFEVKSLLIFCKENPQIQFTLPSEFGADSAGGKLVIRLEYLAFGRDCLPFLLQAVQQKSDSTLTGRQEAALQQKQKISSDRQIPLSWWEINISLFKLRLKAFKKYLFSRHFRIIKKSGLFDAAYYLQQDRDMSPLFIDPLTHYVETGWREGRNPNPLFESGWYRETYKVAEDQDPLLYFIEKGWQKGDKPDPLFFTLFYTDQYPESTRKGGNPLSHYLSRGWLEGKNPNPCFDTAYYLEHNPEIAELKQHPLFHYYHIGNPEHRSPMPFFDMHFYCEDNPKALTDWLFPLLHYYEHGADEGRSPNRFFDPAYYRSTYELHSLSGLELFLHYVNVGSRRQYRPSAFFDPQFYIDRYPEYKKTHAFPLSHYQEIGCFQGLYPCREVADLIRKPLISILTPVYNTDEQLLRRCIHSVVYQAYPHWELCLVDDGSSADYIRPLLEEYAAQDKRIKIYFQDENQGISAATNRAAELASGEYLAFLDHDDELTVDTLYAVADTVNRVDPDVVYSDEELVDRESRHLEWFYKPDFNPELLLCHNYITHFVVIRRSLFDRVGGLSLECTGAQDYDLLLKTTELAGRVHHIRQSLYKWRATETSTSVNHSQKDYADSAGLYALQAAVTRRGIQADVCSGQWQYYYDLRRLADKQPHVSIISLLPEDFQDTSFWLKVLTDPVRYLYFDIQLLCRAQVSSVGSGSLPVDLVDKVTCHEISDDESDAAALNRIAGLSRGEYLIFLRGGLVPQEEKWIETFLGYCRAEEYGIIGGMVIGGNGQVEDPALPDIKDMSCLMYRSFLVDGSFHSNGVTCPQNVIAVSFDYCMIPRSLFQKVAGFDTEIFPCCLYDVDLCLRLRSEGVEHVVTPFCSAVYQNQSKKRGDFFGGEKEKRIFQQRWQEILVRHPYYNEQRLLLGQDVSRDEWLHWVAGIDEG
jgi:glycosyltransferase involved in cell wall biosynthesis